MKKKMNKIIKTGILAAVIGTGLVSCSDDFVDREFYQEVQQGPLKSTQEMQSFVRGAYVSMRNTQYYGADFLAYAEIRSDEMYSTLQGGYYTNVYNYTNCGTHHLTILLNSLTSISDSHFKASCLHRFSLKGL